jgi:molybdopterin-guanine dinucleotide biosynthesis protein A
VNKNITALILAGGNARRMGGVDKGLVKVSGDFLICHVLDRIKSQVEFLMINANRNISTYKTLSDIVIQDLTNQRLGPLGGIQSGLYNCKTPYMISVPCDVPKIPLDICNRLYKNLRETDSDCSMPVTFDSEGNKRTHPAILLLKKELIQSLDLYLKSGGRKIDKWTGELKCTQVLFNNEESFLNINKPEDINDI